MIGPRLMKIHRDPDGWWTFPDTNTMYHTHGDLIQANVYDGPVEFYIEGSRILPVNEWYCCHVTVDIDRRAPEELSYDGYVAKLSAYSEIEREVLRIKEHINQGQPNKLKTSCRQAILRRLGLV